MSKFVGESEDLSGPKIILINENQRRHGIAYREPLEFVRVKRTASIGPCAHWPLAPYGWQSIMQRWTMAVSDLSQALISDRCCENIRSTRAPI